MKKLYIKFFLLLIAEASLSLAASEKDSSLLSVGVGRFNIIRDHPKWVGQIEWKPDYWIWKLRPYALFFLNERYATYISAGLGLELFLSKYFVITPSFGPGLYFKGNGADLHYPLEFRSSMEAAFRFPNCSRLGGQFYHISNAGLGKKNPGSEILILFYSFPLKNKWGAKT